MHSTYPEGPSSVPPRLTEASTSYRRHAWLAMGGLLLFIVVYFGLLAWFLRTALRLFSALAAGNGDGLMSFVAGACALFLAIFMIKALLFNKRARDTRDDIELNPAEQPELFAFLYRLADEAGAPRPRRVFLSAHVNACVFYDLSPLNLIFPSKKNLEIGMGLVNVLNLGEFKAVVAHEFGHFAQRSMAVGRWVYVAQQVAAHIVAKRDALDDFLKGLSRIDFRIAWIGWLLSLVVWSIRSLVEVVFRGVVLAQRALSREMEYQADLVAVSLTGSDALVHALHRLGAADEAWNTALRFVSSEAGEERPVADLFAVQARVIERMREVLADPGYGASPDRPAERDGAHRVFRAEIAQPPQMWSTHPSNEAREANVKRTYIACGIDDRPAIVLFRDAAALKSRITRGLHRGEQVPPVPIEDSLRRLDAEYERPSMSRRYRGAYLGRSIVRRASRTSELYAAASEIGDPLVAIDALYSEADGERIESLREMEQQRALLQAIVEGDLQATGGMVQWRGTQVSRKALPAVLAELDAEIAPLREAVDAHDRRCRGAHLAAAERLGPAWADLLRGQLKALHYAEHAIADIHDAKGLFHNTYEVVTADRKVSESELRRLVAACNQLHTAMENAHQAGAGVVLDSRLAAELDVPPGTVLFKEGFGMSRASQENINTWLNVCDGWLQTVLGPLAALRHAALESLLKTEDDVARRLREGDADPPPMDRTQVPEGYIVQLPGQGRKLQKTLGWWDRFQTADGWIPGTARVAVAGGIVGAVFAFGGSVGLTTISIYNGLDRDVAVNIDGQTVNVPANRHETLSISNLEHHQVDTRIAASGETVESFQGDAAAGAPHLVYNVAGAAALVAWTAVYGSEAEVPQQVLGALRWTETDADFVFEEPPQSISTKGEGGTRSVLTAVSDAPPMRIASLIDDDSAAMRTLAEAHARWDSSSSPHLTEWMMRAKDGGKLPSIIAARLARDPADIMAMRIEQEITEGAAHEAVCDRHRSLAEAPGAKPALHYLALRCIDDTARRDDAALAAHAKWPQEPWLILSAGYAHANRAQWAQARPLLERAMRIPGMAETVVPDLARVRRAQGDDKAHDALADASTYLTMMRALETGAGTEGSWAAAYRHLVRGDLDAAVQQAGKDEDVLAQLLPLIAASDGATKAWSARALAMSPPANPQGASIWIRYALALRDGGDVDAARIAAERRDPEEAAALLRFMDAWRSGASPDAAEAALGDVSPIGRGTAYAMAVVLSGARCPSNWRVLAQRLLLPVERPFFG